MAPMRTGTTLTAATLLLASLVGCGDDDGQAEAGMPDCDEIIQAGRPVDDILTDLNIDPDTVTADDDLLADQHRCWNNELDEPGGLASADCRESDQLVFLTGSDGWGIQGETWQTGYYGDTETC